MMMMFSPLAAVAVNRISGSAAESERHKRRVQRLSRQQGLRWPKWRRLRAARVGCSPRHAVHFLRFTVGVLVRRRVLAMPRLILFVCHCIEKAPRRRSQVRPLREADSAGSAPREASQALDDRRFDYGQSNASPRSRSSLDHVAWVWLGMQSSPPEHPLPLEAPS